MLHYRAWRFFNQPCGCRYSLILPSRGRSLQAYTMMRCTDNSYPAPPAETFVEALPPEELVRFVAARMIGR